MSDPYVYPGTNTLINKLGICDAAKLEYHERELVAARIEEGCPEGNFDLAHLQAIHHHLFQDVYEWAGELRTLEISKGGSQFQFVRYIRTGMADVHGRLEKENFLRGLRLAKFAARAGEIIGDLNYAHPFREGNGRTQLQYLKQVAERAGHPLDLELLTQESWITASKEAHMARYEAMANAIHACILVCEHDATMDRGR